MLEEGRVVAEKCLGSADKSVWVDSQVPALWPDGVAVLLEKFCDSTWRSGGAFVIVAGGNVG